MRKRKRLNRLWALILLLATVSSVLAHGGGELRVGAAAAGPYLVSVWTAPPTPRADEPVHVTVSVADPQTEEPLLDTDVVVALVAPNREEPLLAKSATTAAAGNRLFYETDFTVAETGQYEIIVTVTGAAGQGEVNFMLDVAPPSSPWGMWAVVGLGVVLTLGVFWWWRKRPSSPVTSARKRPLSRKRP